MPRLPNRSRRRNWQTIHRLTRPKVCARFKRHNQASGLTINTFIYDNESGHGPCLCLLCLQAMHRPVVPLWLDCLRLPTSARLDHSRTPKSALWFQGSSPWPRLAHRSGSRRTALRLPLRCLLQEAQRRPKVGPPEAYPHNCIKINLTTYKR